jgi:phosphoglucomutase
VNIIDPTSGLSLGDPETSPLETGTVPERPAVETALASMVLSASGWRTVFAAGGDENSTSADVQPAGLVLAAAAADVFGRYMLRRPGGVRDTGSGPVRVCVGIDTRPTGPVLAHVMIRRFLSLGIEPVYLFVTAAPEIMAYVKRARGIDSFAYVSASHNPIGHNGMKFGGRDGGVLAGGEIKPLIGEYREFLADREAVENLCAAVGSVSASEVERVFGKSAEFKTAALLEYTEHLREVAAGWGPSEDRTVAGAFFDDLRRALEVSPLGVVADLNGSARTVSVDRDLLEKTGLRVDVMNGSPGKIAHRIVPEGESLEPCRERLEELAAEEGGFALGYVPDCDGDRGNIVYYDTREGRARSLEAQEVFALAVLAELGYLAVEGALDSTPAAVAVNGPTSMRIDRIAAAYGVEVFRAEVGEANVVGLARKLRAEGYTVRILGEGSNGGTIIHPSAVRDPLTTLFSLLKLLRSDAGVYADWLRRTGRPPAGFTEAPFRRTGAGFPGLPEVTGALPPFVTTSAYEAEAIMRITSVDHAGLKARYEEIFLEQWEERKEYLGEEFGITSFEEINYEGIEERAGFGPEFRSGDEKGGLKIILTGDVFTPGEGNALSPVTQTGIAPERGIAADDSADGKPVSRAFLWMRGSGTEPVFRVLVDVDAGACGSYEVARKLHEYLLAWHRQMVRTADEELMSGDVSGGMR